MKVSIDQAFALAKERADANDDITAENICHQILRNQPGNSGATHLIGLIKARAGDMIEAERWLRAAAEIPGLNLEPKADLIELLIKSQRLDEAVGELRTLGKTGIDSILKGIGQRRTWSAPLDFTAAALALANPTFSLGGEEMVLRKHFKQRLKSQTPGFYVDIGCSHPVEISNSYLFYCYGWQGVCIDPIGAFAEDYRRLRPRDIFVNAAVTEATQATRFARHSTDHGMHKILGEQEQAGEGFEPPVLVQGRRLEDILSESVPQDTSISFFSIDVEGAELQVLHSNDWQKYRPSMIVLEAHDADIGNFQNSPSVKFLDDKGYEVCGVVPPNIYLSDRTTRDS